MSTSINGVGITKDGQNNYRSDAHCLEELLTKICVIYLK